MGRVSFPCGGQGGGGGRDAAGPGPPRLARSSENRVSSRVEHVNQAEVSELEIATSMSLAELRAVLLPDNLPRAPPGEVQLRLRAVQTRLRLLAGGGGAVAAPEPESFALLAPPPADAPPFHVIVAGDTGAGKSTLLNALLGYEILPTSCCAACTATVIDASWGEVWSATVEFVAEEVSPPSAEVSTTCPRHVRDTSH